MGKEELHLLEQDSFLEWRRQLAVLEEADHFILTPFERNLDIWRQLWRVVELSGVMVQIVDARNPEVFFCQDLVTYASSVDTDKDSILLLNKADLLTEEQREHWAAHFRAKSVEFIFFSAHAASEEPEEELAEGEMAPIVPAPPTNTAAVLSRAELLSLMFSRWSSTQIIPNAE